MIGAEASRIARNAASPCAGSRIPEAQRSFKPETANLNAFLGRATPVFFSGKTGSHSCSACRARPPLRGIKRGISSRYPFYHPNRVWSKGFCFPFALLERFEKAGGLVELVDELVELLRLRVDSVPRALGVVPEGVEVELLCKARLFVERAPAPRAAACRVLSPRPAAARGSATSCSGGT